jgi:hypothetical protein
MDARVSKNMTLLCAISQLVPAIIARNRQAKHCSDTSYTQPVGLGNPAILQACLAGPPGKSS